MIQEAYVSFETAKLLKEKGFYSVHCKSYYFPEIPSLTPCITERVISADEDKYLAPTQQMAMAWLREVHNIYICISVGLVGELNELAHFWTIVIPKSDHLEYPIKQKDGSVEFEDYCYEEACEAAIKYCLENLI